MKKEIKEKWINALRSEEYKKGSYALKNTDKYCCLGVLCDLVKDEVDGKWKDDIFCINEEYSKNILLEKVMKFCDLKNVNPIITMNGNIYPISHLNDYYEYNFKELADLIEEQL